jgi:hypothetical protein
MRSRGLGCHGTSIEMCLHYVALQRDIGSWLAVSGTAAWFSSSLRAFSIRSLGWNACTWPTGFGAVFSILFLFSDTHDTRLQQLAGVESGK